MLHANPSFTKDGMEERLNTEEGMTHLTEELINSGKGDKETTAALQDQV